MPDVQTLEAFSPTVLAADLIWQQHMLADFFAGLAPADWERPTEKGGWTLRQTVAHLASVAGLYHQALEAALNGTPLKVAGVSVQDDLLDFNKQQIAQRADTPPEALVKELFQWLDTAAERTSSLNASQLSLTVDLFAYNRPITVAELLGGQIAHPGLVHAAQLANGVGSKPLWNRYPPDFLNRQLTRFFGLMSHAYWLKRAGSRVASANLRVRGGGSWHIIMNPQGGDWGEGLAAHPSVTYWFTSADAMCCALTFQVDPLRAMFTGKALAYGNLILGLQMPSLFLT